MRAAQPGTEPIYKLETAAERCGVSRLAIRTWIDRGLRAFPLGNDGRYHARDYLIRERWLLEFLDNQSVIRRPQESGDQARGRRSRRPVPGVRDGPALGPCPV
jgi:hypothetical protein